MSKFLVLTSVVLSVFILSETPVSGSEIPQKRFQACEGQLFSILTGVLDDNPGLSFDVANQRADLIFKEKQKIETAAVIAAWHPARFTDPTKHESTFLYLVHGILDNVEIEWRLFRRTHDKNREEFRAELNQHESRLQKLFSDPNTISDLPGISGSLITHNKPETIANSGFILRPDIENVFATHKYDVGGKINSLTDLIALNVAYPIDAPQKIVDATPSRYNEISLAGTSPSRHRLRVIGLFIKTDSQGRPTCSIKRWHDFQKLSVEKQLPIVQIKDDASVDLNRPY